jgi:hypothetical protein
VISILSRDHQGLRLWVGWTIPAAHDKANSLRIEDPIRTIAYWGASRCQRLFLVFRGDFSASRSRAFDSSPITLSEPFVASVCLCLQSTPKTIEASRRVTSRGLCRNWCQISLLN